VRFALLSLAGILVLAAGEYLVYRTVFQGGVETLASDQQHALDTLRQLFAVLLLPLLLAAAITATAMLRRRRAEQAAEGANEQRRLILASVGEGVYGMDTRGLTTFVNPAVQRLTGWRPEDLLGKDQHAVLHHSRADGSLFPAEDCPIRTAAFTGEGARVEQDVFWCKDGSPLPVAYTVNPICEDGRHLGAVVAFRDIGAQLRDAERLRLAAAVFENTTEAVIITDPGGRMVAVNRAFTAISGYSEQEALGETPRLLRSGRHDEGFYQAMWASIRSTGHWQGEVWNRRKDGSVYPGWLNISAVRDADGAVTHYVGVFADISPVKEAEERLAHMAHHDPLTGLPNRLLFLARLEHALDRARREGGRVGVLFMDLDHFKKVNDTLGHPAGDLLLQHSAQRLRRALREQDTVARLGGDEFTVLLEGPGTDDRGVCQVAEKLIATLSEVFDLEGRSAYVSASIGISLYPEDGQDATTLLKHADSALYHAKDAGRAGYRFYSRDMSARLNRRMSLETRLREALERDDLVLHYQPQVEMATGRVVAAEALVRWRSEDMGLVSPGEFISVLEESGLIIPMGEHVLDQACRQIETWHRAGLEHLTLAVNLSARQFTDPALVPKIEAKLAAYGVQPHCLEVEITESVAMQQPGETAHQLQRLHDLGVSIAIDDFGTGYSSLAYLKRYPLHALKIDGTFVRDIVHSRDDEAIVRAILALAQSLRLRTVAEGVEDAEQLQRLSALGCQRVQGYHCGRPLPAEAFAERFVGSRDACPPRASPP
jgi:diguanylate cyclase (GGDEF)-like protein/PAS domain S-box-containing protein